MNLSEELMKDAKLRMELIKELYQEGCQNPLLQFEGCCILGEDEQLLDEIDSYELWVLPHNKDDSPRPYNCPGSSVHRFPEVHRSVGILYKYKGTAKGLLRKTPCFLKSKNKSFQ